MSDKEVFENESPEVPAPGEVDVLSEEQIAALKVQAAQAAQFQDQLLRMAADLENYKKRATRERLDAIKYATESLLERIIPVLDNFEMALAAANTTGTSVQSLQAGVSMIQQQLKSVMSDAGLEEINAAGQPFNPNLHEAISQQETAEVPEGQVVQQVRKGYKLRDRLLRPASVIVAQKPAN